MLTAKGVKPICTFQQVFQSLFLFGAFSPLNGDKFLIEMPECNAGTFQLYLDEFSNHKPHEFKLIVLDNGAFHKAQALIVPDNIALIFLPPYSPELNPAEKIWATVKRKMTNKLNKTLQELSDFITKTTNELSIKIVKSICSYSYVFETINWTT